MFTMNHRISIPLLKWYTATPLYSVTLYFNCSSIRIIQTSAMCKDPCEPHIIEITIYSIFANYSHLKLGMRRFCRQIFGKIRW